MNKESTLNKKEEIVQNIENNIKEKEINKKEINKKEMYDQNDINKNNNENEIVSKKELQKKQRIKEIFNAGQELDTDTSSDASSDTYSYTSTCSTCRSDSTHYHF